MNAHAASQTAEHSPHSRRPIARPRYRVSAVAAAAAIEVARPLPSFAGDEDRVENDEDECDIEGCER
ncbi:unnamed protein product [Closterium sp. NIES-64]|nr:unnamed protein product [Closterium sp. NIES-64]